MPHLPQPLFARTCHPRRSPATSHDEIVDVGTAICDRSLLVEARKVRAVSHFCREQRGGAAPHVASLRTQVLRRILLHAHEKIESVRICHRECSRHASGGFDFVSLAPQKERATLFTVVGVSALSTFAMIAYPMIAHALVLDERAAGTGHWRWSLGPHSGQHRQRSGLRTPKAVHSRKDAVQEAIATAGQRSGRGGGGARRRPAVRGLGAHGPARPAAG